LTRSDLYLGLHVLAATAWIGAAFLMAVLGARLATSPDPQPALGYVSDSEWLGLRLFLPASAATLVSGVLLVRTSPWGFDTLWVQLGLAAFVASTVIGMLVFGPGWSNVGAVARSAGPDVERVRERIDLLLLVGWVDVGIVAGAVWVMSVKPARGDAAALAIAAAIPTAAAAVGFALRSRQAGRYEGSGASRPA
jgi:hypothetical protein